MARPGSGVQAWRRRNAATERSVDAAVAEVAAERRAEADRIVEQAKRRDAMWAAKHAVDAAELVVGRWALDRRSRSGGEIVRVNAKSVTLRDRNGFEWRPLHVDIVGTREVDS